MADKTSKKLNDAYDVVNDLKYRYQDISRDSRYLNAHFGYFMAELNEFLTDRKIEMVVDAMYEAVDIIDNLEEENQSLQKQIEELEDKLEDWREDKIGRKN